LIIVVMGVSGAGKSTVGKALAQALNACFIEGDAFHPKANIDKMKSGQALTDIDRAEWLGNLANELAMTATNAVLACSALKQAYRDRLCKDLCQPISFVYLEAQIGTIAQRIMRREAHFMPISLLDSQFDALEPPEDAIRIDANLPILSIVSMVAEMFRQHISDGGHDKQ